MYYNKVLIKPASKSIIIQPNVLSRARVKKEVILFKDITGITHEREMWWDAASRHVIKLHLANGRKVKLIGSSRAEWAGDIADAIRATL